MGIDIFAYKNLRKTDRPLEHDDKGYVINYDDENLVWFDRGVSDAFDASHEKLFGVRPGYFDGLDDGFYYEYDEGNSFFGCAYSTYSTLRDVIAEYLDDPDFIAGAFREMRFFSDCEGTIGPQVCAKLLGDFEGNRDKFHEFAKENLPDDAWFDADLAIALYDGYLKGLRLAADGGALIYA